MKSLPQPLRDLAAPLRRPSQFAGATAALAVLIAAALVATSMVASAQTTASDSTANLPSAPSYSPNPSSRTNPYMGSVTAAPVTDEVIKLSLDDAVTRGLGNNLGLRQTELGEKTLQGEKLEALQSFLPTISLVGSTAIHEFNLAAFGFGPSLLGKIGNLFPGADLTDLNFITKADVTIGQVSYEQTIFSGPVISGYKAVKAAEQVAYFSKMSARGEVVQQVATAYFAVIADQSEVDNASALLDSDKVLWDQAKAKHEAGTVANLDELRARVQYQQQQQVLVANEAKRQKAEILLKREIGIAPGQKIQITDPAPYNELVARSVDELRTEAYANRQDYQNLQAQQREDQLVLSATRQQRLPTLSFRGNYGVTDVTGIGTHGTFLAQGTIKVPVFREATFRGQADVARAQISANNLQLGDLRSKIDQQVRDALLDVAAAKQLVDVARSNVDLAGSALSDETDRFGAGIDDTLPLTRAQATLAAAQSNLVESLYQYNVTKLQLARSTGLLEQQYKAYLGR